MLGFVSRWSWRGIAGRKCFTSCSQVALQRLAPSVHGDQWLPLARILPPQTSSVAKPLRRHFPVKILFYVIIRTLVIPSLLLIFPWEGQCSSTSCQRVKVTTATSLPCSEPRLGPHDKGWLKREEGTPPREL